MRRAPLPLLALLASAALAGPAGAALPDEPSPEVLYEDGHAGRMLLGGAWLRRLDPTDEGAAAGWQRETATIGWTPVEIPDAWNATQLTDSSQEGGLAWYRRDFELPAEARGARWRIRFESVNQRATVYVNGVVVGAHTGAHLPFEVPGALLREGETNRLVVRTDNRRLPTDLPPFERSASGQPGGGWWNDGGILREVYLRRLAAADVASVAIGTKADGTVRMELSLANTTGEAHTARPLIRIGSRTLNLGDVSLPVRGSRRLRASVRLSSPRLWSPKHPNLYPLRVFDRSTELYSMHVGLRQWSVRGGRLELNGRPIRLFGASMHEDEPGRGQAQSPEQREADVEALSRLGADITRAHYPLHPATVELLDRRGIALWQQIPAYRYSDEALDDPGVRRQALNYLADAIRRDRNHPGLLAFVSGNELSSRPGAGARRYIAAAAALTRRLAPGRLAALDTSSYPTVGKKDVYERSLDALGINEYFGWYLGPRRTTADRAELGPYLDSRRRFYPGLALLVTEFGAEANREGPESEKGSYAFQSRFLADHMTQIARRPFISGAVVWLLRDFRTRPSFTGGNPKPEPPFNQKGLLAYDGTPKPAFEAYRAAIRAARRGG